MADPINPKPAVAGKSSPHAAEAKRRPARGALLTPEEIAVLTGRDETREDDVLSLLGDEDDRLACTFDDLGSIVGGIGIDMIEAASSDDRFIIQTSTGTTRDGATPEPGKTRHDLDSEPSVGVDIINLSAEADEWVMITGHEADDAVAITRK
jgi:hypothetical protein